LIGPKLKSRLGSPFEAWTILVLWPGFNIGLLGGAQYEFGVLELSSFAYVALRLYLFFVLFYVARQVLESTFSETFPRTRFALQLGLHILSAAVSGLLVFLLTPQPSLPDLPSFRPLPITFLLLQIVVFVAAITIVAHQKRSRGMVLNLKRAQLNLLRSQVNPHFLFNTLNLLASEIERSPASAQEVVYDLADLLRESMIAGERSVLSVNDEIHLATRYLKLQQKRFPDRFSFHVQVDEEVMEQKIPALLLQPIVENAIKHGVAKATDFVRLELLAVAEGQRLRLEVSNTVQDASDSDWSPGNGFRILTETLELYYPDEYLLKFDFSSGQAVLAITIPLDDASRFLHVE
jgi:two-component system LytT family sensor kinase